MSLAKIRIFNISAVKYCICATFHIFTYILSKIRIFDNFPMSYTSMILHVSSILPFSIFFFKDNKLWCKNLKKKKKKKKKERKENIRHHDKLLWKFNLNDVTIQVTNND